MTENRCINSRKLKSYPDMMCFTQELDGKGRRKAADAWILPVVNENLHLQSK